MHEQARISMIVKKQILRSLIVVADMWAVKYNKCPHNSVIESRYNRAKSLKFQYSKYYRSLLRS